VCASALPAPTWRAFFANHVKDLVAIDFFTVATVRFEILYVLVILAHDRQGTVVVVTESGGLYRHYERLAA
jgi:hypothetical protein